MAANRLKEHEKKVLCWIMTYKDAEGISVQNLKQRLNNMSVRVIWKAVKFLVNEGHIRSTVDKMHYLSTHFKHHINMSTDATKVLSWIQCFQGAEGVSLQALKQGLGGMSVPAAKCDEAVKFLVNEGYVHHTTDQHPRTSSTDIINNVLRLIKSCQDDTTGIRLQDLNQGLCGMNVSSIRQALVYLTFKGLISPSMDGNHYKLTDTIGKVLSLIKSQDVDEGISLQDMKKRLNGTSLPVIRQAVEFLSHEGLVFSDSYQNAFRLSDPITYRHMSNDAASVLMAIRVSQQVEGISLEELDEECSLVSQPAIWKAVEFLSNEGLIYSTIDQFHYTPSDTINKVLRLIKNHPCPLGISLQDLDQRLAWSSMPFITQAVKSLFEDGLIFSSVDGSHYTLTDTISKVLSLICTAAEGSSLQELKKGLDGMSMPAIWQSVVFLKKEGCIYSTINMDRYKYSMIQDNDMAALTLRPNEKVLSVIKSCQDAEGISLQDLEEHISYMSLPVIWQAVEFLSNEGYIYSTIDQFHYTSTDTINKVLMYIQFWRDGICIPDLATICSRSLAVTKQAVESLVDDGLVFSVDDGWLYKLTDTISKVLSLIKGCQDVEGISLQELKRGLNGISMPAIWQAVVFLRKEGHIVDTMDMEHYMSTETLLEALQLLYGYQGVQAQLLERLQGGLRGIRGFQRLRRLLQQQAHAAVQGIQPLLQELQGGLQGLSEIRELLLGLQGLQGLLRDLAELQGGTARGTTTCELIQGLQGLPRVLQGLEALLERIRGVMGLQGQEAIPAIRAQLRILRSPLQGMDGALGAVGGVQGLLRSFGTQLQHCQGLLLQDLEGLGALLLQQVERLQGAQENLLGVLQAMD